ncbi:hypothetical protein AHF37_08195 [Paragonimus kellicotti]|nr:hypothetical protein AHF37_08195 [Paragonimus kellicotti]
MAPRESSEVEDKIGSIIAENLVEDGATLQTGIGAIPDAVLAKLTNHRHLGVHTEMFSDGVVSLLQVGAITNAYKKMRPGKLVSSFVVGTKKVFEFLDDNPLVGFGGQVDFLRGAALSLDGEGKPIIAVPSTTKRGESKIVPHLKLGGGVVTTRAHVHYVVTEFGIAYLFGRNLRQRAHALIQIAHPDHRSTSYLMSLLRNDFRCTAFTTTFSDMCDVQWVNSPVVIAQNPKPVAINSCIEIDLTGQVFLRFHWDDHLFGPNESVTALLAGASSLPSCYETSNCFGGQVDFLRGAAVSLDGEGKPIIAVPSTTKRGESKIVPHLKLGGGVVTTRAHVHYVVTEFGIAYLFGRNLRQRAHALIQIAHPDHRESLEKAAFEFLKVMPSPD